MKLSSAAFEAGGRLPVQFTCDGENVSPPLDWDLLPEGTKSLALLVDDPDSPGEEPFSHWVLYNIPVDWRGLPQDFQPGENWGGDRGRNSMGNTRYEGPCPPMGETHRYFFCLYAVDTKLGIGEGATRAQVIDALNKHTIEKTELSGTFQRSEATAG